MSITVPLSSWGPRIRGVIVGWADRWKTFSWGTYNGHDPSKDRATDGMVPKWASVVGQALGWVVARAIWKERDKNGIWYVIFYGKIISTTYPNAGWRPYFARNDPSPSKSHKNHVHVSWHNESDAPKPLSSAPAQPSKPAAPVPKPYTDGWLPPKGQWIFYLDKQKVGVKNSISVWLLQRGLDIKPRDGVYTQELRDAVAKWQREVAKNDPKYCDGILGPNDAKMFFNGSLKVRASSK